jgi:putative ABC transport system permease protein
MNDLKFAFRQLIKSPGFTLVAIATLALGIAANTAIFSVVDAVLLHPLPYPESNQIVTVSQTVRSSGVSFDDASPANFLDWENQNSVFSAMACWSGWQANLSGGEEPERIRAAMTSSQFFSLFGVNPILGRTFGPNDARPGNARVAVLSHELWSRRFGMDRTIIGRELLLDGAKFTVIGVMPPGFSPDDYGELWVASPWDVPVHPLSPNENPRPMRDRGYLNAWGRLKPGVTLAQAQAEMSAIAARLEHQYLDANQDTGVALVPLHEEIVGGIRSLLMILLGAVSLVLLIACANVANLLLARAASRSREIAIRTALGASRLRLVGQLLTESTLLALLGGALGVLLAFWALPILLSFSPPEIGQFNRVGLNTQVLIFSLIISMITGALFGLAPAFFASRSNPNESLREGERGSSLGKNAARSILIAGEIALSLVLLVGAGLMMKSFVRLTKVDPGFNPKHLLVFNIGLPSSAKPAQQTAFYEQVVERIQALPGVKAVGAVSRLPLAGGNSTRSFNVPAKSQSYEADIRVCTPDYFQTMAIPLLKGRNFSAHDSATSLPVAIINEATAASAFPGQDPIGKFVTNFGPNDTKLQIIGVTGNVRHVALEKPARPEIYLPLAQASWPSMFVAVRSAVTNPLTLIPSAQNAVWSIDRNVPLANPRTMQDVLAHSVLRRRFAVLLLSIFAGLASVLAAVGLYGVISYSVAQRTREFGIRIALGATPGRVISGVLHQGFVLVAAGSLLGVGAALALTRTLSSLLFEISPLDVTSFAAGVALLGFVALCACVIPAWRASRVDPMDALHTE